MFGGNFKDDAAEVQARTHLIEAIAPVISEEFAAHARINPVAMSRTFERLMGTSKNTPGSTLSNLPR
jgi:hypothetical protein